MPFTGVPTVTSMGRRQVQLTGAGFFLALGATGTIGNPGSGADVTLPATFPTLTIAEAKVIVNWIAAGVGAFRCFVAKAGAPVLITIGNGDGVNATPDLEILIEMPHSVAS